MRSLRSTAGAVAAVLAVGAIGVVGAGAAHAATTVQETGLQLFGQVNNNGLSGVQNLEPTGTPDNTAGHTLTVTVSPSTSVIAGSPISITISSPTLTICNGPAAAAAAKGEELDAVVVVAGKQYLLRGPQNSSAVPASTFQNANHASCVHPLFNTGWVVSSTPGGSSATSDTTATAATHGLGTATPTAPSTVVALTAPATAGTFPVAVKGLVVNSLTAPATAALTDPFDEFINLDNGGHSAADVNGVSYCDNSATCANGYAGPGGIAGDATDSPNGVGSFLANDPGMYLSAASATRAMTTANYLGTTVDNPTARDLGLPASTTWTPNRPDRRQGHDQAGRHAHGAVQGERRSLVGDRPRHGEGHRHRPEGRLRAARRRQGQDVLQLERLEVGQGVFAHGRAQGREEAHRHPEQLGSVERQGRQAAEGHHADGVVLRGRQGGQHRRREDVQQGDHRLISSHRVAGGPTCRGANALLASAGPRRHPEKDRSVTNRVPLDLETSPRDNLYAFGKTWGTFSEDPVVSVFHGAMYAYVGTKRLMPLFGHAGAGITKCRFVGEGADERMQMRGKETGFFYDLKTWDVIDHWDNPFTGETVEVYHFLNDKIGGELTLEMPKLYVGDDPEHGVHMNENIDPNADGSLPFILPWSNLRRRGPAGVGLRPRVPEPALAVGVPEVLDRRDDQPLRALRDLHLEGAARGPRPPVGALPRGLLTHLAVLAVDAHGRLGAGGRRHDRPLAQPQDDQRPGRHPAEAPGADPQARSRVPRAAEGLGRLRTDPLLVGGLPPRHPPEA